MKINDTVGNEVTLFNLLKTWKEKIKLRFSNHNLPSYNFKYDISSKPNVSALYHSCGEVLAASIVRSVGKTTYLFLSGSEFNINPDTIKIVSDLTETFGFNLKVESVDNEHLNFDPFENYVLIKLALLHTNCSAGNLSVIEGQIRSSAFKHKLTNGEIIEILRNFGLFNSKDYKEFLKYVDLYKKKIKQFNYSIKLYTLKITRTGNITFKSALLWWVLVRSLLRISYSILNSSYFKYKSIATSDWRYYLLTIHLSSFYPLSHIFSGFNDIYTFKKIWKNSEYKRFNVNNIKNNLSSIFKISPGAVSSSKLSKDKLEIYKLLELRAIMVYDFKLNFGYLIPTLVNFQKDLENYD